MTLATTQDLIEQVVSERRALASLNVITLEHAEGIVLGAERAGTPVVLQISENAILFRGGAFRPLLAACREVAIAAAVPVALHLDHLTNLELVDAVLDASTEFGISSIMIDASELENSENIRVTREVADAAHAFGLWVEAELGTIGGKGGAHRPGARTDPAEASDFVNRTHVDGLAVAVGSAHAMAARDATLDFELLDRLSSALPVPLVLHGSSGVPDEGIREAVARGIRKVNVGTALNQAARRGVLDHDLSASASSDPRPYLRSAREAIAQATDHICRLLQPGEHVYR